MANQRAQGATGASPRADVVVAHVAPNRDLAADLADTLRRLGIAVRSLEVHADNEPFAPLEAPALLVLWGKTDGGGALARLASEARRSGLLLGATVDGATPRPGTVGPSPDLTHWDRSLDESLRSIGSLVRACVSERSAVTARAGLSDTGRLVDFHRDVAERTRLATATVDLEAGRASIVSARSFGGPLGRSAGWHLARDDRAAAVAEPAHGVPAVDVLIGSQLIRRSHAAAAPDPMAPRTIAPDLMAPRTIAPDLMAPRTIAPDLMAPRTIAPGLMAPRTIAPLFWREAVSLRSAGGDGYLVSPVHGELQLNATALTRLGLDEPECREVTEVVSDSLASGLPPAQVIESTVTHLVLITGDLALRDLLDQEPGDAFVLARRADLIRVLDGGDLVGSRTRLIDMFFDGVDPARRIGISPGVSFRSNTMLQDLASGRVGANPITVVTGAAGTGKSQLAANLVAETIVAGGSVLVTGPDQASVDLLIARTSIGGRSLLRRVGARDTDASLAEDLKTLLSCAQAADVQPDLKDRWRSLAATTEPLDRRATQLVDLDAFGSELADGLHSMGDAQNTSDEARTGRGLSVSKLVKAAREQLAWVKNSMASLGEIEDLDRQRTRAVGALRDEIGPPLAFQALYERLKNLTRADRSALVELAELLAGSGDNDRRRTALFDQLLGPVPGWACPVDQLTRFFGPTSPVIDLVIVDEASAVDMGAALPLFGRSRRLLIMGDHDGLRATSSLTASCVGELAERSALSDATAEAHDPRHTSLLDLGAAAAGRDVIRLEHQHRGAVTADPFSAPEASVVWVEVAGSSTVSEHARSNRAEADAVVATVRWIVEAERSSVAVLTPFDEQVALIRQLLADAGLDSVRVGRSDQLRGDERDVIVLSTVLGPGASRITRRMAGLEDRVHQALTRARERIIVVGDPQSAVELGGELGRIADSAARITTGPGSRQVA